MKYVSIDIETTGLDPAQNQILEVAAVIDNLDLSVPVDSLPYIQLLTPSRDGNYNTNLFCAVMHQELWQLLSLIPDEIFDKLQLWDTTPPAIPFGNYQVCYSDSIGEVLQDWLDSQGYEGSVIAAGKNVAMFDIPFIKASSGNEVKFAHRTLDPGTLYLQREDEKPPSLQTCLKRAGLQTIVRHRALDDARDVCRLIRKKFEK